MWKSETVSFNTGRFRKLFGLFVSISTTDVLETALKQIFSKIKFSKEKVSQKSDK